MRGGEKILSVEDLQTAIDALTAISNSLEDGKSGPGRVVQTKCGIGRTFNSDDLVNGKMPVYLSDGKRILCSQYTIIGFID